MRFCAVSLLTGTDSPVSADSSIFRFTASVSTRSAGTWQPASSTTRSPGIRSAAGICLTSSPSRSSACGLVICFSASSDFFAFPSCITPTVAFNSTTARIIAISPYSRSSREIAAATNRIKIRGSFNCSRKLSAQDFFSSSSSTFFPRSSVFPR